MDGCNRLGGFLFSKVIPKQIGNFRGYFLPFYVYFIYSGAKVANILHIFVVVYLVDFVLRVPGFRAPWGDFRRKWERCFRFSS